MLVLRYHFDCCVLLFFFFLMIRRPPRSTRTDTLFPCTTLFRSGVEHVEHVAGLETGALADLEVVEIMPWRDLDRARAQFGIGMFVGDHLEAAAGDRLEDRSEEHTSELQSLMRITYAVFCLKNKNKKE